MSISLQITLIYSLKPLIIWTLDGKLIHVNYKSTTLITDPIAKRKKKPSCLLKLVHPQKNLKTSILEPKKTLRKHCLRPKNTNKNINLLIKLMIMNYQRVLIGEMSRVSISPTHTEIKKHVAPAILFHSLRSPNRD